MSKVTAIFGLMRGDEGKGKIVDLVSKNYDIVIRYAGGPNAGHTIYRNNKKIVLHQIPSGILNKNLCIIARGCVVDLKKLVKELLEIQQIFNGQLNISSELNQFDRTDVRNYLLISYGSHIITQNNIFEDIEREDSGKGNGSTKCGIAPTYRDKYYRSGLRLFDLIKMDKNEVLNITKLSNDEYEYLMQSSMFIDEEERLNEVLSENKLNILFEGAQGTLLDIDSPYYPNVSSSSTGIAGIISGTGINPNLMMKNFNSIGVAKIYMSSVGVGKFLTELNDDNAELIRDAGKEYGATTGRPRKVGWLDLPLLKYSIRTSGIKELCITRFDTLMEAMKDKGTFKVCIDYKNKQDDHVYEYADIWNLNDCEPIYLDFPIWKECSFDDENFKSFIEFLKFELNIYDCELKYLSIGKNKNDILTIL